DGRRHGRRRHQLRRRLRVGNVRGRPGHPDSDGATLNDPNPEPNVDFKLIATPAGGTSIMGLATILTNKTNISVSGASAAEGSNTLKFLDHFISPGSGGLSRARSSVFGPDGNLYVASADTNAILRYDPTGEFINAFVPSGSGGLSSPWDVTFGP